MSTKKPKMAFKVREYSGQPVLWPADTFTREWILAQPVDSLHWVTTHRPRSPRFHRAVHKLCGMLAEHLQKFTGMDAHNVLKVLQLEAKLYCDTFLLTVPGFGTVMHLVPQSISFDSMDEAEFRQFYKTLADHVALTHWPEFSLDLLERSSV